MDNKKKELTAMQTPTPEIVYFPLTVFAKIKSKQETISRTTLKRKLTTKRKAREMFQGKERYTVKDKREEAGGIVLQTWKEGGGVKVAIAEIRNFPQGIESKSKFESLPLRCHGNRM